MFSFKIKDKKPQNSKEKTKGDYVGEYLIAYGNTEPAMPMAFNVKRIENNNNINKKVNSVKTKQNS